MIDHRAYPAEAHPRSQLAGQSECEGRRCQDSGAPSAVKQIQHHQDGSEVREQQPQFGTQPEYPLGTPFSAVPGAV